MRVKVNGVDVFHPNTGEVRSDGADGIACWFIDTDYNEESFFVRHAYFLGANDPYSALKTTLKAEINAEAWATLQQRHVAAVRQAEVRPDRREGHQPPGRRGDEGVQGMSKIFIATRGIDSWRQRLASPERHWRRQYSAFETAVSWESAARNPDGLPTPISRLFANTRYSPVSLITAVAEHKVRLDGKGAAPSATFGQFLIHPKV